MGKEFGEIISGIKRSIGLLNKREKNSLYVASFLMLITGILTNFPAVVLGKLVDKLIGGGNLQFNLITPFVILVIVIILVREILNVQRKLLIEKIATQTDKEQTVNVISRLLKLILAVFCTSNKLVHCMDGFLGLCRD